MTISWTQKAWYDVKVNSNRGNRNSVQPEKRCWLWEGTRKDGRSFRITHIPHLPKGYVCQSFNGLRLGAGLTLSEAQMVAENAPPVCVPVKVRA